MSKIIVIGGGAAGMIAAIQAAQFGDTVILLEKNDKLGKKLFITGKGRCNITNACEPDDFFANVVRNQKFMYSSYYAHDCYSVMDLFEQYGLKLKVERGQRVFPESDHSSDVIRVLDRKLQDAGVEVRLRTNVEELVISQEEAKVCGVRLQGGKVLQADAVIVATGGKSYPLTGSTGDGYRFAKAIGIRCVNTRPSLVPLEVEEDWCKLWQGVSLKNVRLKMIMQKGKRDQILTDEMGEMLFTHFGVSGPLVLSASAYYASQDQADRVKLHIDLKPALSLEQLDHRLLREFEAAQNKQFKNILPLLLPSKMVDEMIVQSGIPADKPVHSISKEERMKLIMLLKNLTLSVRGTRGWNEAVITCGGIDVKEINPSTMESKSVNGLYFAGEVLDVDAFTGGYNLQIAWSTGWLAGESASKKLGG